MPTVGFPELVIIGMILVLVFGASRFPQLGESAGRALRRLLKSTRNDPSIGVEIPPHVDEPSPDVADAELVETDPSGSGTKPPRSRH